VLRNYCAPCKHVLFPLSGLQRARAPHASCGRGRPHLFEPGLLCGEGQPARGVVLSRLVLVGTHDAHHGRIRRPQSVDIPGQTHWSVCVVLIVGRRSEIMGGAPALSAKKKVPLLTLSKIHLLSKKNQPKSAKKRQNSQKYLKVPKMSSKWSQTAC
jgi:hypothetical protein